MLIEFEGFYFISNGVVGKGYLIISEKCLVVTVRFAKINFTMNQYVE